MIILTRSDVQELLTSIDIVGLQRRALLALEGDPRLLAPQVLLDGGGGSTVVSSVARVSGDGPVVARLSSMHAQPGGHSIDAYLTVLDPVSGTLTAVLDGEQVTSARTPAATVLAVAALRPQVRVIGILGSGVQARAHAAWFGATFPGCELRMWSPAAAGSADLADWVRTCGVHLRVTAGLAEAVRDAQVILTATTAAVPVLSSAQIAPGALVISIGSVTPDRAELDDPTMARAAAVVVDHVPTALAQVGPLVRGLATGAVHRSRVLSIGSVLAGAAPPGTDPEHDLTVYLSVGVGIQDAVIAAELVALARHTRTPKVDLHR